MSSAAARHCRKRRRDDAHGDASPTRRRRLAPSPFPAARCFGLRVALASGPHSPCKHRHGESVPLDRLCCRRSPSRLPSTSTTSPLPAVRPIDLRPAALAPSPRRRRRRKLRADDASHHISTPPRRRRRRRHRSSSSPFPRVRLFPGGVRPFALRFLLLATGASAPRRLRNPAAVNMGSFISQLLGRGTSDGGLDVHRKRLDGSPEVVDLTLEPDLEPEKVDVLRRAIADCSVSAPPEKRAPFHSDALEWTRLQESGFEVSFEIPQVCCLIGKKTNKHVFSFE